MLHPPDDGLAAATPVCPHSSSGPSWVLPNFLGVGVQRAATTWLHMCLSEHPEVFVPQEKELHYFSSRYDKGWEWYLDHFAGARGHKAIGEITPTYIHEAPLDRLKERLPEAKLLVILREPLARAYSAYRLLHQRYAGMSFEEACTASGYLISRSLYADRLSQLFSLYPKEQIKILLYEDVSTTPFTVLRDAFEFLEVDPTFRPRAAGQTYNRILFPRAQRLLAHAGLEWAVDGFKRTPVGTWIKSCARARAADPADRVARGCRTRLMEIFRPDIERVQELTGRDLSAWL